MASGVRTKHDDKVGSKQRSSKPIVRDASGITEHIHPATVIQQARREPGLLSPSDVLRLQRTTGNSAVQRFLLQAKPNDLEARSSTNAVTRFGHDFSHLLVQRDVTSDIAIDSADFWTHLRSRTFTRLVPWIGDSRQKLNEFVDIMGDTDTPSAWGSVALSWIQVLGTGGDIVSALVGTIQTLGADVDSPSTLFEFRNTLERNFDALSTRVNDPSSDLPIYEALRQAESKRTMGPHLGPETLDAGRANRQRARVELERALDRSPPPIASSKRWCGAGLRPGGRTATRVSFTKPATR